MPANRVVSKDGTSIAFDRVGAGPPLILVDAAMCYSGFGPSIALAKLLAEKFTVYTYDRRGRGESGDTQPYALEREIEDIEAILTAAGGSAFVWGFSSGGILALEAANRLSGIRKLAMYEPPLVVDESRPATKSDWMRISYALAAGRRGDAVKAFLKMVGVPAAFAALMPIMPMWSRMKAIAHTLPYDGAITQDYQQGKALPAKRWASVKIPALVMDGGNSEAWMRNGNRALANALPNAQYRTLEGQKHDVKPKAHAPVLIEFFGQ